ncbi:MAG: endonuclease/exonuclease/phosphatase [Podila humilis]|nr:MAG: endonuclease/exonuclease/phosphatase [Podila humilis]
MQHDNNKNNTNNGPTLVPIRLYTHNIRYASANLFKNELPWSERASLIIRSIRFNSLHNPESLICLQEVLHSQLLDILEGLGPEWAYIGVGRDDGKKAGEYSPILFRSRVWTIQDSQTIWLSPTPEIPSKGWDASNKRILTSVLLRHWETGQSVLALNTHLDDQGTQSRLESAKMIVAHIAAQQEQHRSNQQQGQQQQQGPLCKLPIFLAGDFNSTPDEEAYLLLATESSPLLDLRTTVGKSDLYGHENTFTGFESRPVDQKRIDFLFLSKDCWHVQGYGVLETKFEDGVYSSDHRPVVGDVALPL